LPLFTVLNDEITPVGGGGRTGWGEMGRIGGRSLVVDDTVYSGNTFQKVRRECKLNGNHVTAAIYTTDPARSDMHYAVLPHPHLLEWNLFNSHVVSSSACDMDGIICHNPPRSTEPLYVARRDAIGTIITARLEKHREATVEWLARYGIQYRNLVMWQGTDSDRNDLERVAAWKANEVRKSGATLYIESEPALSDAMRKHGIVVLCPKQGYMS
jgi:hypothetical protein